MQYLWPAQVKLLCLSFTPSPPLWLFLLYPCFDSWINTLAIPCLFLWLHSKARKILAPSLLPPPPSQMFSSDAPKLPLAFKATPSSCIPLFPLSENFKFSPKLSKLLSFMARILKCILQPLIAKIDSFHYKLHSAFQVRATTATVSLIQVVILPVRCRFELSNPVAPTVYPSSSRHQISRPYSPSSSIHIPHLLEPFVQTVNSSSWCGACPLARTCSCRGSIKGTHTHTHPTRNTLCSGPIAPPMLK